MEGHDESPAVGSGRDTPRERRSGRDHLRDDAVVLAFRRPQHRPQDERLLREVIGPVLREERLDQGRTLADVAEAAAVSLPYLSEVERGTKEASSMVLRAITTALGVGTPEILERCADRLRAESSSGRFRCLAA